MLNLRFKNSLVPCDFYILRPQLWIPPRPCKCTSEITQGSDKYDLIYIQFYSYGYTGKAEVQLKWFFYLLVDSMHL